MNSRETLLKALFLVASDWKTEEKVAATDGGGGREPFP